MISDSCSFNNYNRRPSITDIGSTGPSESRARQWWIPSVPDLYFKVVDPKLQVADLKSEVGELRSSVIPLNLTTALWPQASIRT